LDPISVKESIHLFPNPSSGELYIQGNENVDKIEIYDLNGQLILNQLNPNSFIDISCLAKQTYIITLYTNESVYQEKLILI
ncbi:MAG: T9SS type A sorting domain-containing protein, partial [Crocinitomicaceae bacterium]|nr:T9SS type A sorting domain-containing protein [Crocinitomicaceae bacterium]